MELPADYYKLKLTQRKDQLSLEIKHRQELIVFYATHDLPDLVVSTNARLADVELELHVTNRALEEFQ